MQRPPGPAAIVAAVGPLSKRIRSPGGRAPAYARPQPSTRRSALAGAHGARTLSGDSGPIAAHPVSGQPSHTARSYTLSITRGPVGASGSDAGSTVTKSLPIGAVYDSTGTTNCASTAPSWLAVNWPHGTLLSPTAAQRR
jgi:hypothetical protein